MTSNEFHPPKRRPAEDPIFILLYADIALALSQALVLSAVPLWLDG